MRQALISTLGRWQEEADWSVTLSHLAGSVRILCNAESTLSAVHAALRVAFSDSPGPDNPCSVVGILDEEARIDRLRGELGLLGPGRREVLHLSHREGPDRYMIGTAWALPDWRIIVEPRVLFAIHDSTRSVLVCSSSQTDLHWYLLDVFARCLDRQIELAGGRVFHAAAVVPPDGRTAAICGAKGAGKTTILHMLLRLGCRLVGNDHLYMIVDPATGWPRVRSFEIAAKMPVDLLRQIGVQPEHTRYPLCGGDGKPASLLVPLGDMASLYGTEMVREASMITVTGRYRCVVTSVTCWPSRLPPADSPAARSDISGVLDSDVGVTMVQPEDRKCGSAVPGADRPGVDKQATTPTDNHRYVNVAKHYHGSIGALRDQVIEQQRCLR